MITPASLQALQVNLNLTYANAFADTPSWYQSITQTTRSTARLTEYPIFDRNAGKLRKWSGERVLQEQSLYAMIVRNDKYEGTVRVLREDIEDSQFDVYGIQTRSIAREVALFPDQQITTMLEGNATTSYDNQPLFSASHPLNNASSQVQSNLLSSATTGAMALSAANLASALVTWRQLKGIDGAPLNTGVQPVLMVPPALEWIARTILNMSIVAPSAATGGNANSIQQQNVLYGAAQLIVNPWLTSTTAWYLFDGGQNGWKPFIYQIRIDPEFTAMQSPTDPNVFFKDEFLYGVRLRAGFGVSLWYLAMKMDT